MDPNLKTIDMDLLAACIRQAWEDDYPPELAPANVKGRKMWRKKHLVDLISRALTAYPEVSVELAAFREAVGSLE